MTRYVFLIAVLLAACAETAAPPRIDESPQPVAFRTLREGQNAAFCVEGPQFEVATTEEQWIDVFDRHTACQPASDVVLPSIDFDQEVGAVAWWKVEGCLGFDVRTRSVVRTGNAVTVTAVSTGPKKGEACATALGGLESFLALDRTGLSEQTSYVFVLDGKTVGRLEASL